LLTAETVPSEEGRGGRGRVGDEWAWKPGPCSACTERSLSLSRCACVHVRLVVAAAFLQTCERCFSVVPSKNKQLHYIKVLIHRAGFCVVKMRVREFESACSS
ncbi:hypothetical protein XENOCAPTIV_023496, partial [Xenoophorus captivus]